MDATLMQQAREKAYAMPLDKIDMSDPALFETDTCWPYFERLRKEAPIHYCKDGKYGAFWSVTRFEDILALNKQAKLLSSAHGIRIEDQTEDEVAARRTFQETDDPAHAHSRALLAVAFSKKTVAQFED